ncbi:MAG: sodium-dependent transporter, partial [Gemmatimonadetes bacterium]
MSVPSSTSPTTSNDRGTWGSELGFLLAAVGSAVGLGNMWRFSATASTSGGAAFVMLYLVLTFVIGVPLLMCELALGRRMRLSPIGALRGAAGPKWVPLGILFVISGFVIFAFYAVIAGWAVRYGVEALIWGLPENPGTRFGEIATGPTAAVYHVFFVLITAFIVAAGVKTGIEKAAKILMPLLFAILVGLAIWAFTLPGAGAGYEYYLKPDFSHLLDPQILSNAAGQTYFSLSLGMGAILTFASYMGKKHDIGKESTIIALADFGVAFMAGLVVFPVVFALGFQDQVIGLSASDAEGVLFIALPGAFGTMGFWGRVVGVTFFLALSVAALTSTISLLEVVVSSVIDELGWDRKKATWIIAAGIALLGLLPAFNIQWLVQMNSIAGELFLAIGAFLTAIVVGWFMKDPVSELAEGASPLVA